jgi:hypothetical protein
MVWRTVTMGRDGLQGHSGKDNELANMANGRNTAEARGQRSADRLYVRHVCSPCMRRLGG